MNSTRAYDPSDIIRRRTARGLTQQEVADRSGLPRSSISAIEGGRLTPSVSAALALADALGTSVEILFGGRPAAAPVWLSPPPGAGGRLWKAQVGERLVAIPAEGEGNARVRHDAVWRAGVEEPARDAADPRTTLVVASCDPAAEALAAEYERVTGFRMLVLTRSGGMALELLRDGLIHLAGVHRATPRDPQRNLREAQKVCRFEVSLIRYAAWDEGLVLPADRTATGVERAASRVQRWAMREPGAAARLVMERLCRDRRITGRVVHSHTAVAEAVRAGWADGGICVRAAVVPALRFLPVQREWLDYVCAAAQKDDPRIVALHALLHRATFRALVGAWPGFDPAAMGEEFA